ncbi:MAG: tyrosine-protein phosphatase [Clostridia bacterium]|nr:tyrosine-protein phosphatase [Clostridia bacterium]
MVFGASALATEAKYEVTAEKQSIGLEGVENCRQLGGYPAADGKTVKQGLVLRTGELAKATDADILKLKETYHLGVIVDFREQDVIDMAPDPAIDGVKAIHVPVMDEELKEKSKNITAANNEDYVKTLVGVIESGSYNLENMYVNIVNTDAGKAGFAKFFRELLENEEGRAILYHCSYGKDRTGIASVLFLSAMGVDEEIIIEDFALTNTFLAKKIGYMQEECKKLTDNAETVERIADMIGVPVYAMENMIRYMNENYGSVYGYITGALGVTEAEIAQLRSMYLE